MGADEPIGSVHVLQRQSNRAQAQQLLQRVAAQVRPVMQARGWHVPVVREFLPRNANLLGVNINGGQEIRIRLRPAHDPSVFLAFGDLVGTMLHELAHIVRGPHDAVFYATLDALREETQRLMDAGYAGDGFYTPGRRVGGSRAAPTMAEARVRAAAAAARRTMLGGPPRTLAQGAACGWRAAQAAHSPAQMAARAAERRLRDEKWCGDGAADTSELIVISDSESDHAVSDHACSVVMVSDVSDNESNS
ncbi:hypothetical protein IW150_002205 [Coemansia sp. RSA 2607]|nr:hypothetical protein IW150_002205 [Coemansia sp. RSA 2607]